MIKSAENNYLLNINDLGDININQLKSIKTYYTNLYELAKEINDEKTMNFCKDILKVFDIHDINGHIEWEE